MKKMLKNKVKNISCISEQTGVYYTMFQREKMKAIRNIFDALKATIDKGFRGVYSSLKVVPLLYLKNMKPRNPNTIKGLRFVPFHWD